MAEAARKPLISGNWKMNLNHFEATALVQKLVYELTPEDYDAVDVSIHPPFTVIRKVHAIFTHGMTPILCVGETLDEREDGTTEAKVTGQVRAGLGGLSTEQAATLVIAYEPIWAIGTGRTATPDDAQTVCATVRATVAEVKGAAVAEAVRIQYGGSVKAANAAELMACPDVDGALVGG